MRINRDSIQSSRLLDFLQSCVDAVRLFAVVKLLVDSRKIPELICRGKIEPSSSAFETVVNRNNLE